MNETKNEAPQGLMYVPGNALDDSRQFSGEIAWLPPYMLDAFTAVLGASHILDAWYTVPRLLFTSADPHSGKTTCLDLVHLLGNNAWDATGATSFSLRSKFSDRAKPFPVLDEIHTIYGTSGLRGENSELGRITLLGFRRKAVISMSVDRTSVDVSVYCFMAMAGLRSAVPNTIYTRCIPFAVKAKPAGVTMPRNSVDPDTETEAEDYRAHLHAYMNALRPYIKKLQRSFRPPHPLFVDRKDQIWRAPYLTALASDQYEQDKYEMACQVAQENGLPEPEKPHCTWAARVLTAFKAMALDASDLPSLLPAQKLLRDVAAWFRETGADFAFAADLKDMLRENSSEEAWDVLTDKKIENLMGKGLGPSTAKTVGTRRAKGFYAAPVLRAWDTLEASLNPPAVMEEDEPSLFDDLEDVTQVTHAESVSSNGYSTVAVPAHTRRKPRKGGVAA